MVNKKTIWATVLYLRKFKELSKAVQLVSIAKLRKLTKSIENRNYALSVASEMFDELCSIDDFYRQCTFIVITSERSCCGKINNDVISNAKYAIESFLEDNKKIHLISKGRNRLFHKYKYDFVKDVSEVNNVFFFLLNIYFISFVRIIILYGA